MTENVLALEHVQKRYGKRTVLQDINVEVPRGQGVAFLGKNGAGKSTLLKIASGLVRADGGKVICDRSVRLAYVPEKFPQLPLTAEDYLRHVGEIAGLSVREVKERCAYYFEAFDMADMAGTPMKVISKGTLQKVLVIQAVLRQPDILFLDEPLSGQDTDSQQFFIDEMIRMKQKGLSVIMACHEEFLVRQIADVVFWIKNGRLEEGGQET